MHKIGDYKNDLNNISIPAKKVLDNIILNDPDYFTRNEVLDSILHIIKKNPLLFQQIVEDITNHKKR